MVGVTKGRYRPRAHRCWGRGLACAMVLSGCATPLGALPVIGGDADLIPVKLLRPAVAGRSCRTSILGVRLRPGSPTVDEAVMEVLALDAEANVVTHAELTTRHLFSGFYNRRCIIVRGDLGRMVHSITLPTAD
jgi:hypothetical protein